MLRSGTKSATQLTMELRISRLKIDKWAVIQNEKGDANGVVGAGRKAGDREGEVVRLRRELVQTKVEVAILNKALTYLTK